MIVFLVYTTNSTYRKKNIKNVSTTCSITSKNNAMKALNSAGHRNSPNENEGQITNYLHESKAPETSVDISRLNFPFKKILNF